MRGRDPLSGVRARPAPAGALRCRHGGRPPGWQPRRGSGWSCWVAACSAGGPGHAPHSGGSGTAHPVTAAASAPGPAGPSGPPAAGALSLQVTPAPYQLPSGLAREVVLPHGPDLLIAGGLTLHGTSTAAVRRLNLSTGSTTRVGRLAVPMHDAAGATIGGRTFVFGGGQQAARPRCRRSRCAAIRGRRSRPAAVPRPGAPAAAAGRLPRPRSDLAAVTQGGTTYLLGGYDGTAYDATVLATTDGRRFTRRGAAGGPGPLPGGRRAGRPDLGLRRPDQPRHHERHPADKPSRCGPRGRRSDR